MQHDHVVDTLTDVCIEGRRLVLTPLQMDNVHTHYQWNNDPDLNRMDSETPFEPEPYGRFLRRFERLVYDPPVDARDFEVHVKDGSLIGVAYVDQINPIHRRCRVGVTIGDRDRWGQGYGGETLRLLLHVLFTETDVHRVATASFEYNTAWKRILADTGFQPESCLRDYVYREGRYWDMETYSMLRSEYEANGRPAPQSFHLRHSAPAKAPSGTGTHRPPPTPSAIRSHRASGS